MGKLKMKNVKEGEKGKNDEEKTIEMINEFENNEEMIEGEEDKNDEMIEISDKSNENEEKEVEGKQKKTNKKPKQKRTKKPLGQKMKDFVKKDLKKKK